MATHPAAGVIAQVVPQAQLATIDMISRPEGVTVVLLCPFNQPDAITVILRGNAETVVSYPTDRNPVVTAIGPAGQTMSPGMYGLAPCVCCDDNRWRIALPIIQFDGWEDHLVALAHALGLHILAHPELYCRNDLETISLM